MAHWNILKNNNKYFNPYQEYEDYETRVLDSWSGFFTHQNYEGVAIKNIFSTGQTAISFKKNKLIVALDIFFWFLSYSLRLDVKHINSIYFNDEKI
jgi:hypothetical protein